MADAHDDCLKRDSDFWAGTNQTIEIGQGGFPPYYRYSFGVRFQNITIPQGATIISAYLWIYSFEYNAGAVASADIWGNDVDDAAPFSTLEDFNNRALTDAMVDWYDIETWFDESWHSTPDIGPIIQEIINRPGWQSGNAIALIVRDDGSDRGGWRRGEAWNWNPTLAARLEISYMP